MWGDGWGMGWGFGWMMLLGGLVPLLFLGLLVFLVAQAMSAGRTAGRSVLSGAPPAPPRHESALETAQRRYAAGEISREEFVRIRDDLGGGTAGPSGAAPMSAS